MKKTFLIKRPESQLADELRRRIAAGDWSGKLPGIRKIMAEFDVTRTTTEGALAELAANGDLSRGGSRLASVPIRKTMRKRSRDTLILLDTPLELRGGDHRELIVNIRESLPGEVEIMSLSSRAHGVAAIIELVKETGYERVLVADHKAEVADALAGDGRAVVALGVSGSPAKATAVGVSHEQLVRDALKRAFGVGHRRVCFPLWIKSEHTVGRIRSWVADEYALAGFRHAVDFDTPLVSEPEASAMHDCLRKLLRHTPPTAFIVADLRQWLATTSVLAEAGMRIPRDVSVICLSSNPELDAVTPSPACFRYPLAKLARTVLAGFSDAERGLPPRRVFLESIRVEGASLASPSR